MKTTSVNRTSISNALDKLRELGIARELTGNKRNRLFAYSEYLDRLAEETEPLR